MALKIKHLLGLRGVSFEDITLMLDTATGFKGILEREIKKVPTLRGKTIVNLFYENSTRTLISFELAETRLSADLVNFSTSTSSVKGETLKDTIRNIEAMKIDMVVVRHASAGVPKYLTECTEAVIVNAGDGANEHPTQGLLDMYTMREHFGKLAGLKVVIIGDIAHSRVARSNIWGLTTMGAEVWLCGPATLIPGNNGAFGKGVTITSNIEEALAGADVVMALRIQLERNAGSSLPSLNEYRALYGLTPERLELTGKKDYLVMHPGPINRGIEINTDAADGSQSVILRQVTNGVAVRMAVLYLLGGEKTMLKGTILITNGQVVSPKDKINDKRDLLIADGKIVESGKNLKAEAETVIDARGCIVCPGLIDMHVHLREPGREDKETVKTGTAAAAAGGITAVAAMANTTPVVDNETVVKFILDRAKEGLVRVYPVGAVTRNMEGEALAEIGLMRRAGIVAISEDGKTVMNSSVMKNALRYSTMDDLPVLCHCEDANLGKGVVNAGKTATALGLGGIPRSAEEVIVARDIMLAKETGAELHIQHVSTKGSVELIRGAKKEKVRVTAETAPHYFTLTDEVVSAFNPNYRVNPPLRGDDDKAAIILGLQDGTIDAIATDHAPHTIDDKDQEFDQAPCGMAGLETSVGVTLTELVHKKKITLSRMVELMSVNPAAILKVPGGSLKKGAVADITIINPTIKWSVDATKFKSKGKNTPFAGMKLTGKAVATIVGGKVAFRE